MWEFLAIHKVYQIWFLLKYILSGWTIFYLAIFSFQVSRKWRQIQKTSSISRKLHPSIVDYFFPLFKYETLIFVGTWDGIQRERRIGFVSFSLHTVILTTERCRWLTTNENRKEFSEEFSMLNTRMNLTSCWLSWVVENLLTGSKTSCHSSYLTSTNWMILWQVAV